MDLVGAHNLLADTQPVIQVIQVIRHTHAKIFAPPVDRISRLVREVYWDGLTRRIDEQGLSKILADEKTATVDGFHYVYVPPTDKRAYDYFTKIAVQYPEWKMKVVRLPQNLTPEYVRNLDGYHGILSLAIGACRNGDYQGLPFVVPGGRFNEMYGWDSYFIQVGLLRDGEVEKARDLVDNFVYEIEHYGTILNANRTYYLTRSQPPFLTEMVLGVYRQTRDKAWLRAAWPAVLSYYRFWTTPPHLVETTGLSRYYDMGNGPAPEVLSDELDAQGQIKNLF